MEIQHPKHKKAVKVLLNLFMGDNGRCDISHAPLPRNDRYCLLIFFKSYSSKMTKYCTYNNAQSLCILDAQKTAYSVVIGQIVLKFELMDKEYIATLPVQSIYSLNHILNGIKIFFQTTIYQNNYMEGSGSATIKLRSPSQAPRGRGNLSKQKPHSYR